MSTVLWWDPKCGHVVSKLSSLALTNESITECVAKTIFPLRRTQCAVQYSTFLVIVKFYLTHSLWPTGKHFSEKMA